MIETTGMFIKTGGDEIKEDKNNRLFESLLLFYKSYDLSYCLC